MEPERNETGNGQTRFRFHSILFPGTDGFPAASATEDPEYFHDLFLDQIVEAITANWQEYDLGGFYRYPLSDPDAIAYRQEIMGDLDGDAPMLAMREFAEKMRTMRVRLEASAKSYYPSEKHYWVLDACHLYCTGVETLSRSLQEAALASRGLLAFRDWLAEYVESEAFLHLAAEMRGIRSDLGAIRYEVLIDGAAVTVLKYDGGPDYSAAVEETFEKFQRGAVKSYLLDYSGRTGMNHIEAQIVERVARLFPEPFARLQSFCADQAGFAHAVVTRFDREIQFYVAYLAYISKFRKAGLEFCRPELSRSSKVIAVHGAFDPALASKLIDEKAPVVCNDFHLADGERIFVVTGPNQGGKTTFARMVGQLHYLARLGCMVPGSAARLFLCDALFAHFERQEDIRNLRGKLQDDLVRIKQILDCTTPGSLIIMNEIFSSTTLRDAVFLSKKIMDRISRSDALAVCVTFLDELATFDDKTVSLVCSASQADPAQRTFKVERRPAEGLAYALAIAEKHRVTGEWLKRRIAP